MIISLENKVSAFLSSYGFVQYESKDLLNALLYDMQKSLDEGTSEGSLGAIEPMIPTWTNPPKVSPKEKSVIVIDAGGTNFRSCLVKFDCDGKPQILDIQKTSMPGILREYKKDEFFDTIAKNLEHLKNQASIIGFCFSYEMEISPDGDGCVKSLSKEIQAKEVVGCYVGKCLSDALVENGWNRPEKIALLNDTTAALLAGAANTSGCKNYDSYVGFILGTGMNCAYIESDSIKKLGENKDKMQSQIVVTEAGSFNKLPKSLFDKELDDSTKTKGRFIIEKMCSGAYLGPLASVIVRNACKDGLFSKAFSDEFAKLNSFELMDVDAFLKSVFDVTTKLGHVASCGTEDDYSVLISLLNKVIARSAQLSACIIAAAVIKSGKGKNPAKPVCITCNGTTFYKTHGLKDLVIAHLHKILTEKRNLNYEIVSVENDITLGTAVAALK